MRSALTPALSQIRSYPSRFVAVTLAVVLGVGFVAATLVFSATYRSALADSVAAPYRGRRSDRHAHLGLRCFG